MVSSDVPCAASSLVAGLLDGGPSRLVEVSRTRLSVHYATGRDDLPVLCVADPSAVRLPCAVLAPVLPRGDLVAGGGALRADGLVWRTARWWRPDRPRGLRRPSGPPGTADVLVPLDLVGRGEGLTPHGDDVLAGALVAAHAVADPRLPAWARATREALRSRRTTAVSHALLVHALDGFAVPELAAHVEAVCAGEPERSLPRLLTVGHSSGAALAAGVARVLPTGPAGEVAA